MTREPQRKTPEDFLREVQAEEAAVKPTGHLKIFLGYASGVGKSFRMLDEARRRRERGQDVVVGGIQPQVPSEVGALLEKLEVIPLRQIGGGAAIDVDAIVRRHPAVCVIDGLAYDNPPGARNPTRWQDVRDIVAAGIKVIGSINIQYITELRPDVEAITGKKVRETVPVSFIQTADEIEIVDAPAEGQAEGERNERLAKLRELALVLAADVVDHQLTDYLERSGIRQTFGANKRILVCITPRANAREMIDTARTISQKFHGELIVTYVHQPEISPEDKTALEEKIAIAKDAGAAIEVLEGDDPADAILSYARSKGVTQLFVGHSQRSGLLARLFGNPVDKLIRGSHGMDVRIFPQ